MKKLNLFLLFLCTLGVGFLLNSQKSLAVTAADWKPGRIIDDVIFQNKQAMTVQQIQQFLDSKVPTCDRWGSLPMWSGGPTRAQWSADNGRDLAPYTCLKEYVENPTTKANNANDPTVAVPGGLSAAQLIYNASQAQNINPQVYLVLLQKEQSLVTDDWPYAKQFERATGNNCPDTAPCNPAYAWLSTQVNNAGAQFNYYVTHFDQYNYAPGWNNILYSPTTSCGTRGVQIENKFTAALYIYTPYTPNQAALNNMYGTGDSCSAYGNRNFWRLFNDWFGASLAEAYAYTFVSSTYSNVVLETGQKKTDNTIVIKNNGSTTWYADGSVPIGQGAVRLASLGYQNIAYADISDPAWLGTRNQIRMTPASVAPGENATFTFSLEGPALPLKPSQLATFVPVVNGVGFMPNINMQMLMSHVTPQYSFVSASGIPNQLLPNQQSTASIVIKNTGITSWYADGSVPIGKNATRLSLKNYGETGYADRSDPAWLGTRNQIRMTPASVAPGENATFTFSLEGPFVQHFEKLHFVPVLNGVTFMQDIQMFTFVGTPKPAPSYSYVTAMNAPAAMISGNISNVSVTLRNTGNTVWRNAASRPGAYTTRLIMSNPGYRNSSFYNSVDTSWLTAGQIGMTTPVVMPGESGVFTFTWKAPTQPGLYQEGFLPVIDGFTLMPDFGMRFDTTVSP